MTTRRDVPEPWASAMIRAGVTDPRNDKRPSMNQLAQLTGVHTSTITSMVWGERDTDQGTLDRVAEVLRIKPSLVAEWAGRARDEETPYEPPAVASLMTQDQRNIVDSVIRQFTAHAARGQKTGEGGATVTPITKRTEPLQPPSHVAAKRTRKGEEKPSE